MKIIYCSRTHTQLSQFIQELNKTAFGPLVRAVSLASRKKMCIHPRVSKLGSVNRINEVCLDMKTKGAKGKVRNCNLHIIDKKYRCMYYDIASHKLYKDHVLVILKFKAYKL